MFHPELVKTKIVQSIEDLQELADKLNKTKVIYFDTETSGLRVRVVDNDYIVGWTFAVDDELDERVFYIPVAHDFEGEYELGHIDYNKLGLKPEYFPHFDEHSLLGEYYNMDAELVRNTLKPILERCHATLVAHNEMFDCHVLENEGIDVNKILDSGMFDDTMLMYHTVHEEDEKKLELIVARRYDIHKTDFDDVCTTITNQEKKDLGYKANQKLEMFNLIQIPIGAQYSAEDVYFMKQMYPEIFVELEEDEQLEQYYKVRKPFLPVLWNMEREGIRADKQRMADMTVKAEAELQNIIYQIFEIAGIEFNIASNQECYEMLFGHKKTLKDKKTGTYRESFNKHLIDKSFGFEVEEWTDGGKEKDKKLKNPKVDKAALKGLLLCDPKDDWQEKGLEVVELILKHNKLKKLIGTYMKGMINEIYQDGKIHPSLNICGTETGRISCSNPNLLNLPRPEEEPGKEPKIEEYDNEETFLQAHEIWEEEYEVYHYWKRFEIRGLFVPDTDDDVIIAADYNNLEGRISAHFSQDKKLIDMFLHGHDGHGVTATAVFDECKGMHPNDVKKKFPLLRQKAKSVKFLMDYGGTQIGLSKSLKISKKEAQKLIDNYFEGFSGLAEFMTRQKKFARKYGFVYTILGRKRHLPHIYVEKTRYAAERNACNAPIQGTAADVIARAQMKLAKNSILKSIGCTMRLQIYDEMVFNCPRKYVNIAMEQIELCMEHSLPQPLSIPLPVVADYAMTYADAK